MQNKLRPKYNLFYLPQQKKNMYKFNIDSEHLINSLSQCQTQNKNKINQLIMNKDSAKNTSISQLIGLSSIIRKKQKKKSLKTDADSYSPFDILHERRKLIKDLMSQRVKNKHYLQRPKEITFQRCKTLNARQQQYSIKQIEKELSNDFQFKYYYKSKLPLISNKNIKTDIEKLNKFIKNTEKYNLKTNLYQQKEVSLESSPKVTILTNKKQQQKQKIKLKAQSTKNVVKYVSNESIDKNQFLIQNSSRIKINQIQKDSIQQFQMDKQKIPKNISMKLNLNVNVKRFNSFSQNTKKEKNNDFQPWNNKQEHFGYNITNFFSNPESTNIQNLIYLKK